MKKLLLILGMVFLLFSGTSLRIASEEMAPDETMTQYHMYCNECSYSWWTLCQEAAACNCLECWSENIQATEALPCVEGGMGSLYVFDYYCPGCGDNGSDDVCVITLWDVLTLFSHVNCQECGRDNHSDPPIEKTGGPWCLGACYLDQ